MLAIILVVGCIQLFSSNVFGSPELSIFENKECDRNSFAWTSWFNTQDPMINNGNDIEDITNIRVLYEELDRCKIVSNVEYSIVEKPDNTSFSYKTYINRQGLFCMGSRVSPCPNYKVRFCCSITNQSSYNECGRTFTRPILNASLLRIINGLEAMPHSFPWTVSLQYKNVSDCGGAIIDERHILTAAHCLDYSNDLGNYYARVGAHNISSSGELIPISNLVLHPNYNEQRSSNDIGIIRLAKPIVFSPTIQPICLTDNIIEPQIDTTVYVAGWGSTQQGVWGSSSLVLLQARLRVIANCSMYFAYDSEKQICTAPNGPVGQNHGSCQGDSGGGLLYQKNGRWYVAGVVSYAIGCGQLAYPTVFTKTAAYIDWIRATMNSPM